MKTTIRFLILFLLVCWLNPTTVFSLNERCDEQNNSHDLNKTFTTKIVADISIIHDSTISTNAQNNQLNAFPEITHVSNTDPLNEITDITLTGFEITITQLDSDSEISNISLLKAKTYEEKLKSKQTVNTQIHEMQTKGKASLIDQLAPILYPFLDADKKLTINLLDLNVLIFILHNSDFVNQSATLQMLLLLEKMGLNLETVVATLLEAPTLTHTHQITFANMGFKKAGRAYFSPDSKKIVFQAIPLGKKGYQIYLMDLEERIPRMISTGQGTCTSGSFSPDGQTVIFASNHEDPHLDDQTIQQKVKYSLYPIHAYTNIYRVNLDGSDLTALTYGSVYHGECSYSPDGSRIVYSSNQDGHFNLYTMAKDGSDVKQITQIPKIYHGACSYSADGNKIVFRADYEQSHCFQIYVIDSEGNMPPQQITEKETLNYSPNWHPNGKWMTYTSVEENGNYELYLLEIDSKKTYRLTYHEGLNALPAFNYEGNLLMWTSERSDDQTMQIFIADFSLPTLAD